jgi:hypothetical protein
VENLLAIVFSVCMQLCNGCVYVRIAQGIGSWKKKTQERIPSKETFG